MLRKLGVVTLEAGFPGQAYSYQCDPVPPLGSGSGGGGDGPDAPPDSGGGPGGPDNPGDWPPPGTCGPAGCYFDEYAGALICCWP